MTYGRFRAPVGFVIAGLGAAAFIMSGFYDLWWHTLYGFDVTLVSPPHFGLLFSGPVIIAGALYAFASEANRARLQGDSRPFTPADWGVMGTIALLMGQLTIFTTITLDDVMVAGPVNMYGLAAALFYPLGLMAAASFLRRPSAATITALLFTLLKLFLLWYAPWVVQLQASIMGYSYREYAVKFPIIGFTAPAYLVLAGLIIDLALAAFRRAGIGTRISIWMAAAVAALVNHLIDPRWMKLAEVRNRPDILPLLAQMYEPTTAPMLFVVPVVAALAGWLGWNLGIALRYTDR
jgi:hypothetical protein